MPTSGATGGGGEAAGAGRLMYPAASIAASVNSPFVPPAIHAGGLRYHGDSVLVSQLYHDGILDAVALGQRATFQAGQTIARTTGIVPAPEAAHAAAGAIDEALACRESGQAKTILFTLSGHGHFDMAAYKRFLAGELDDCDDPGDAVDAALAGLPGLEHEPG